MGSRYKSLWHDVAALPMPSIESRPMKIVAPQPSQLHSSQHSPRTCQKPLSQLASERHLPKSHAGIILETTLQRENSHVALIIQIICRDKISGGVGETELGV